MLYNVEKETIMNKLGVFMDYTLTDKESKLVENNVGLVHMVLKKMNLKGQTYEDSYSDGILGLIEAAHHFDETRKVKFSTYAVYYIKGFILSHLYPAKKKLSCISLQTPFSVNDVSNGCLQDILVNPMPDEIEQYTEKESFEQYVNKLLNSLFFRQRIILLYRLAGFTFSKIAAYLHLSIPRIVQIKNLAIRHLSLLDELTIKYKEVFYFEMKENHYCISFFTSEIQHFNAIFAQFLTSLTSTDGLPSFRIISTSERVTLYLPEDLSSFALLAQLLEKIDLYGFQYTSSPRDFEPEKAMVMAKSDYANIPKKDLANLSLSLNKELKGDKASDQKEVKADITSLAKLPKSTKQNELKNYILSKPTFSVCELQENFPHICYSTMALTIRNLSRKNLIKKVKQGDYQIIN